VLFDFREPSAAEAPSARKLPLNRVDIFRGSATKWQNVSGGAVIFITLQIWRDFSFLRFRRLNSFKQMIA